MTNYCREKKIKTNLFFNEIYRKIYNITYIGPQNKSVIFKNNK